MTDDYVPRPTRTNTGWIVGLLVLLLLVPLVLCGLGLVGFGLSYSTVEVQRPPIMAPQPPATPTIAPEPRPTPVEVPDPDQPPFDPDSD